jgi:septal ring factor EnvC (AmiA/AmiB activator)
MNGVSHRGHRNHRGIDPMARAFLVLLGCLLCTAAAPQGTSPDRGANRVEQARRDLAAAQQEARRAESGANQAEQRLRRAEENLKAIQVELGNSQREQRAAQQRLSSARTAENRAQRDLDAAQGQAR